MSIRIGSARHDENGKYVGGKDGDQTGTEVSMQDFYTHTKGWYILRLKSATHANACATAMKDACDNDMIGYDMNAHGTIIATLKKGYTLKKLPKKQDDDCSGLDRACIYEATGKDVGAFNTANQADVLEASGLFYDRIPFTDKSQLCKGDTLVTKTKGHTVIVVSGAKSWTAPSSNAKTVDEIAEEVIAGKWGNEPERKNKITAAGYDYAAVKKCVNEMLGKSSGTAASTTASKTSNTSSANKPSYVIGKTYTVVASDLKVRTGAGTTYAAKKHSQLTADGQKHDKDNDGALDKGTKVTCKEVKSVGNDIWIRTPSGWIAAYYDGEVYVK